MYSCGWDSSAAVGVIIGDHDGVVVHASTYNFGNISIYFISLRNTTIEGWIVVMLTTSTFCGISIITRGTMGKYKGFTRTTC